MAVPLSNMSSTFTSTTGNTAIKMTVADTANSADSNLLHFVVNTESRFRVDVNGNIYANNFYGNTFISGNNSINNKFIVAWILS